MLVRPVRLRRSAAQLSSSAAYFGAFDATMEKGRWV